ncbi:MAG: hypothetical protein ACK5KN_13370 [Dysgonomonas sp.]|jgi:uncharacterized protein (DUF927 family)|uniref:hypothetical protein n=1 Tax=unclassified Dysgonomonas TaxID=2630389 RepID=UPI0025C20A77|nr:MULTISPECIES: hypothetical protein [unclassified Dysgonomonas]MDR1715002.1 hypothetical protein [Prevotella sp.]MDR2001514.1 hypothetical protein [Prevotella sp.]HMM03087.1 hypothetical protein [Dysgonomonas sp.]
MKRLSILFVAILAFSISSFASNDYEVLWVLNNKSTFNTVTDYVQASPAQKEQLGNIFYDSAERLKNALQDNDKEGAWKALAFNLANTKSVLSAQQYRKYLAILNATYQQTQGVLVANK